MRRSGGAHSQSRFYRHRSRKVADASASGIGALDARNGREIWHYARPVTKGVIHRATGALLWDIEMADYRQHYSATSAPLIAGDLVLIGSAGGDEGARGFLDAYRASTGERAWRFWTMPRLGEPLSETWAGRAIEHGCAAP